MRPKCCSWCILALALFACGDPPPPVFDVTPQDATMMAMDVAPVIDVVPEAAPVVDVLPDRVPLQCMTGTADCNNTASDGCEAMLTNNTEHCGRCGNRCPSNDRSFARCVDGRCVLTCIPGTADCDSNINNGCETSLLSGNACGSCDSPCPGSMGFCARRTDGVLYCTAQCPAGSTACGAACADLRVDLDHCGRCGFRCEAGLRCVDGMCVSPFAVRDASTDATPDAVADVAPIDPTMCQMPSGCSYACVVDLTNGMSNCTGAIRSETTMMGAMPTATLRADLTGFREIELTAVLCDPRGWLLHVADSPSCNGYGGDSGQFEYDAEFQLENNLAVTFGAQTIMSREVGRAADFVPNAGCSRRTLRFSDRRIEVTMPPYTVMDDASLRLNPPSDSEGRPDALWYIGLNRTYGSASRSGTGVRCASFCVR